MSAFILSLFFIIALQLQLPYVLSFSSSIYANEYTNKKLLAHKQLRASSQSQHTLNKHTAEDGNNRISISTVNSNQDIISLAKLRYQEWIISDTDTTDDKKPDISNFCRATAEIYHERKEMGSVVFIATYNSIDGEDEVVVGAAELSPIEFQNDVIIHTDENADDNDTLTPLYITDVVTSSSHRRMGIGSRLMNAVESHAYAIFDTPQVILFLHVEHDNIAAIQFYKNLGCSIVDGDDDYEEDTTKRKTLDDGIISISIPTTSNSNQHLTINANKLAIHAGTMGQLLMMKQLSEPNTKAAVEESSMIAAQSPNSKEAGGFGKKMILKQAKKKKKKRK